jgi:hypothetical protein
VIFNPLQCAHAIRYIRSRYFNKMREALSINTNMPFDSGDFFVGIILNGKINGLWDSA